ncbi:DMT family transporter [Roseivirga sp. BDSF3-8]|uniref:DMT family transporter n=1 Tax=Roseivirga sp. BDSF3-8 TaxID=3241598 RepID=UPI003532489C
MSDHLTRDYIKLHFIVFIWGFTAILGKLISIPSVEIVFYRVLIAALALAVMLKVKGMNFNLGWKDIAAITATGFVIAAHWILFFASAKVSTVSVCLAGMATATLFTSILDPLFNRRPIRLYEVMLGLVVIAGLYIIFRFELDQALGLVLALISAFLAALFTVINSRLTKRHNHYMITFYEMSGATLGIALFFPIYTTYFTDGVLQLSPTAEDWLYIGIISLVCTVYAYSISVELMKRLTAFAVNLAINLEPVYGIALAVIILNEDEKMNSGFYLGTLVILLSVLAYPVMNRWRKRRALKKA